MDDKSRENAKEIRIRGGISLDDVVNTLNSLKKISSDLFFVTFNGVKLYSNDDLTLDDVYKKVTGYTKSEVEENERKWHETAADCKKQAASMIEQRYEKGIKYIYPERFDEWKEWLEYCARNDSFNPENVKYPDVIIECLKRLENGEDFETVFEFVKNFSEMDYDMGTASTLLDFSKVGPEYLEYVYKKKNGVDLSGEFLKRVEAKKEENRKLAELHKSEREVSTSEIGEVARGVTLGNTTKAMNAVTNSKDEPVIENDGQSHDDE